MLEKTTEMNYLYDYYGSLLTKKQQFILECYYHDDWSLSEIANHQGTSRQAVFEGIKRAQQHMTEFEAKLELVAKHRERQQLAKKIITRLESELQHADELVPLIQQLVEL
jgi:predicted DNA-binding protein YlxM (UPF0122 family)